MSIITPDKEVIKDRQQLIWIASRRYMLGEIGTEELAAVEKSYNLTIRNAVTLLAKQQQKKNILSYIKKNVSKGFSRLYLVFLYRGK